MGIPNTEAYSISETIESPCPPITKALVSLETSNSVAMYVLKRIVSRILPMPTLVEC